jgi:hypothetical protein
MRDLDAMTIGFRLVAKCAVTPLGPISPQVNGKHFLSKENYLVIRYETFAEKDPFLIVNANQLTSDVFQQSGTVDESPLHLRDKISTPSTLRHRD